MRIMKKGKVTSAYEFCRALCKAHAPPTKEFIYNSELEESLNNSTKNQIS